MEIDKRKIDAYKKTMNPSSKQKNNQKSDLRPQKLYEDKPKSSEDFLRPQTSEINFREIQGLFKVSSRQGIKKAAKLLIIIGKEQAVQILKLLPLDDIEKILHEVSRIKNVDKVETEHLLKEFGMLIQQSKKPKGGKILAEEYLTAAFGPDRAKLILSKALVDDTEKPFDFLNDLEFSQILSLIKGEKAPVVGVLLAFIKPETASKVFEALHPDVQREVVGRIARMQKIHPDVIVKLEEVLREKVRRQGKIVTEEIDGKNVLANILKYADAQFESKIISELEEIDPEVAEEIKERSLTIDIVEYLSKEDFQAILRDFSDKEIGVILKGKNEETRNFFFNNLSDRRIQLVREEMQYAGPMKRSEVDQATKEFVLYIKQLEEDGKISIYRDKDAYI